MELGSVNRFSVIDHCRNFCRSVFHIGCQIFVRHYRLIGVNKVHIGFFRQISENRTVMLHFQLVPAHMWDHHIRSNDFFYFAGDQPQTVAFFKFVSFFKNQLHTQTNSQKRFLVSFFLNDVGQSAVVQHLHGTGECPYAGQNQCICFANCFRIRSQFAS